MVFAVIRRLMAAIHAYLTKPRLTITPSADETDASLAAKLRRLMRR
jgi:hypothetical protein